MVGQATSHDLAIQTVGLTKVFRDFWGRKRVVAVEGLDLAIRRHEVYGLLGPNGSGKSTTIKMLLGLLFPSRGAAQVLGRAPGDLTVNARIGYLPEETNLYPFLTARETLDFYGRLFGLSAEERRRRSDSLLEMVGLAAAGRRLVGEFSKGMQRRIGLAQALINDPELLILDEPTSGLDPLGTRQIKDLILALGRRGKTVLLCSHLLADVEDVCDRIGILYGGRMQREGPVRELLARSEMTQIRCGRLGEEAVAKVRELLRREQAGDRAVEVETPTDRLEDYFLRVVAAAQAEAVATSGALAGAGVSDFLTSGREAQEEVVIEELVRGGAAERALHLAETRPAGEPAAPVAERTDDAVLQSLLREGHRAAGRRELTTPVEADQERRAGTGASGQPDRSLIERLLGSPPPESEPGGKTGGATGAGSQGGSSSPAERRGPDDPARGA